MLRIHNSQSRQKEDFKPLDPAGRTVTMYACGPTVYDSLHLGHARAMIAPDTVRRYLAFLGHEVRYVTNFTDIDDKIIRRANAENRDWKALTEVYIAEYHEMARAMNVLPAAAYPRATETVPEMLDIVRVLIERKHAYVASDGDVYFDTASYHRYGALSGRNLEDEDAGHSQRISQERMAVKRNPGDFVLWKLSKPGEPWWDSPYGKGRPGWHLECSAMSRKFLGVPFDIHGGGQDLLFPHHEDEKAQTECAYCGELNGGECVRYWVHNGFLTVNNEKMGKSLGNAKWLKDMIWPLGPHDPMAVRMIFLSAHYRAPLNIEPGLFDEATARLERIYNTLDALARAAAHNDVAAPAGELAASLSKAADTALKEFRVGMDDDFNTAAALGAVFVLVGEANQALIKAKPEAVESAGVFGSGGAAAKSAKALLSMLEVLGIRTKRAVKSDYAKESATQDDGAEKLVHLLLQVRTDVRAAKLYAVSDKIRDGLKELGWVVEDLPGGKYAIKRK